MANWMQKILGQGAPTDGGGSHLPAKRSDKLPAMGGGGQPPEGPRKLPPASIVYGVASALLFAMAFYHFFTGRWFTGMLVLLPAGCFLGFAWHFAKHAR